MDILVVFIISLNKPACFIVEDTLEVNPDWYCDDVGVPNYGSVDGYQNVKVNIRDIDQVAN